MMKNSHRVMMLNALITLFSFVSYAQAPVSGPENKVNYRYPLEVPMNLSGNYGELRSNHFHGGIDFRIGGVVGASIFATEEGYISRISVSPSGYGNALYITHPNGYVSVYGHMLVFNDKIQSYVRDKQYESEAFRQDLALGPGVFPVFKGEFIGKAGNSGSSGGPHLHFEIRDTANLPLNVFEHKFLAIRDNTPPVINSVAFFGYSKDTGVVSTYYIGQRTGKEGVVKLPAVSYIAIDAVDKQEGTTARLAVNEYKVYLDTSLIYRLRIGEVPFAYDRYINSLMEYSLRHSAGKYMIKSYVEPGNLLCDRIQSVNDGLIVLQDNLPHKVKVEVLDHQQNRRTHIYTVQRDDAAFPGACTDTIKANFMAWHLPGFYSTEGLEVRIPQAALYNSIYFRADTAACRLTPFAPVWRLHSPEVALHFPAEVLVKCNVPDSLAAKALLVQIGKGGKLYAAGGNYDPVQKQIKTRISALGEYTVALDMKAPTIICSIANNAVVKGDKITFIIRDELSGIKNYRVEIDGHWVLAELDGKTSRVTVPLPHARIKKGGRHNLAITVTDNAGNTARLKRAFTW